MLGLSVWIAFHEWMSGYYSKRVAFGIFSIIWLERVLFVCLIITQHKLNRFIFWNNSRKKEMLWFIKEIQLTKLFVQNEIG